MKPFNLEEAKQGKPVCIRDGRPARIICFDRKGVKCQIMCLIERDDGTEHLFAVHSNGKYLEQGEDELDIMMVGEPSYRPFESQEECWEEMHKHYDFGWLKVKESGNYIQKVVIPKDAEYFEYWYERYTFTDGHPFGKEI